MRHTVTLWAVAALVAAAGWTAAGCKREVPWTPPKRESQEAQPPLPTTMLTVGVTPLEVEVADEPQERKMGYMFRDEPRNSGMLFVFPDEDLHNFIMLNVKFDIDLAYIADDGSIFQIEHMKAFGSEGWRSMRPAKYALEVPAGWFETHNVKEGMVVKVPPEVKAKDDAQDTAEE